MRAGAASILASMVSLRGIPGRDVAIRHSIRSQATRIFGNIQRPTYKFVRSRAMRGGL